jgi:hypothetical protein
MRIQYPTSLKERNENDQQLFQEVKKFSCSDWVFYPGSKIQASLMALWSYTVAIRWEPDPEDEDLTLPKLRPSLEVSFRPTNHHEAVGEYHDIESLLEGIRCHMHARANKV